MSEFMNQNKEFQPILELITTIMDFPEDQLTDTMSESILGMVNGALSPTVKREAVTAMMQGFNEEGYTKSSAQHTVNNVKKMFAEYIDSLNPSQQKRKMIEGIFNSLYDIFDSAIDQYHNYDITLPIKLEKGAIMPMYAYDTDAAADLYAIEETVIAAHSLGNKVQTGVHLALPEGWAAYILPRSSIGSKTPLRLSNSMAVIDPDYTGPLVILYDNISDSDYTIKPGDRIAQLLIMPVHRFKGVQVDILPETDRGENGLGSTGK